ncbi:hypothetical protein Ddc_22754 [Ditylenchus destructor]|nr:hypothetical protein Ddc_22754 [Ditylenchus destructor]
MSSVDDPCDTLFAAPLLVQVPCLLAILLYRRPPKYSDPQCKVPQTPMEKGYQPPPQAERRPSSTSSRHVQLPSAVPWHVYNNGPNLLTLFTFYTDSRKGCLCQHYSQIIQTYYIEGRHPYLIPRAGGQDTEAPCQQVRVSSCLSTPPLQRKAEDSLQFSPYRLHLHLRVATSGWRHKLFINNNKSQGHVRESAAIAYPSSPPRIGIPQYRPAPPTLRRVIPRQPSNISASAKRSPPSDA